MADLVSRLPTQDQSDGAVGNAAPSEAILLGAKDPSGNLQPGILNGNNELLIADVLNASSQYRAQSVTTTAAEALGGSTILSNRKLLHITPTNGVVYWGYDSSVTVSTGTPLFPNNTLFLSVTNNVHVYIITAVTTDCRIGEVS